MDDEMRDQLNMRDALLQEMAERAFPDKGKIAAAARAMNVSPQAIGRWVDPKKPGLPETEEHMEAVRHFLHMGSIYDLGPFFVATMLWRADQRKPLDE